MKTFLIAVALFAAVACAAPKNKRDVSHLLKDGEYLPPNHHEHHHHHEEESAPQPGYRYPVPQASLNNQYLAPQPSVNNQYLAPQPSENKEQVAPQPSLNNQYLAPQASVNKQYLAPVAKASEPEVFQLPSTSYGVPFEAIPAPAPMEVAAPAEDHLVFDAPVPEQEAQQPIGANGGYVY